MSNIRCDRNFKRLYINQTPPYCTGSIGACLLSLSVGAKPRKGWACRLPLIAAAEPLHMSRTAFACQRDVTSTPEARANRFTFSSCRSGPVGLVFCVLRGLKLQTTIVD